MNMVSSETWFVRIHDDLLSAEDLLPVAEHAKIAREASYTWIKLEATASSNAMRLPQQPSLANLSATLPGDRWLLQDAGLVRPGHQVPDRDKPVLKWKAVKDFLNLQLPRFQVAARPTPQHQIPLKLVRGGKAVACEGLLTTIKSLAKWIEYAPESRLKELSWVVQRLEDEASHNVDKIKASDKIHCILLGARLPLLEGIPLVANGQVLTPAGFRWEPDVSVADLRQVFKLDQSQWLIWLSSHSYSTIADDMFATMTRASVRHMLASQTSSRSTTNLT